MRDMSSTSPVARPQMNIQFHKVITDITDITGMRILKAIIDGERDPAKLAQLRDYWVKSSSKIIAKSLEGDWQEEHLFAFGQKFEFYEIYRQKIIQCDQKTLAYLTTFASSTLVPSLPSNMLPRGSPSVPTIALLEVESRAAPHGGPKTELQPPFVSLHCHWPIAPVRLEDISDECGPVLDRQRQSLPLLINWHGYFISSGKLENPIMIPDQIITSKNIENAFFQTYRKGQNN
jgi:hypothetical protein